MANSKESGSGTARSFAPGTFDHTRQNIGPLDPEEAKAMVKKLGGEVLPERSVPFDEKKLPNRRRERVIRASGVSARDAAAQVTASAGSTADAGSSSGAGASSRNDTDLPNVDMRTLKLMNALMMSDEYQLKPDYGMFNFFFQMSSRNKEKVTKKFGSYTIKKHVEHIEAFTASIRLFIQLSPETYRTQLSTEPDLKFKLMRQVAKWNLKDIKLRAIDAADEAADLTIPMLKPFVRAVYHELLTIYYIGEQPTSPRTPRRTRASSRDWPSRPSRNGFICIQTSSRACTRC